MKQENCGDGKTINLPQEEPFDSRVRIINILRENKNQERPGRERKNVKTH